MQKMGDALGVAAKTHKVKTAAAYIIGNAPVSHSVYSVLFVHSILVQL